MKKVTRYGNICGPGYQNINSWIVKTWTNLQDVDIDKSFEYCGLTSSNQDKYHSKLKKILTTNIVPANVSIETKEVDEKHSC